MSCFRKDLPEGRRPRCVHNVAAGNRRIWSCKEATRMALSMSGDKTGDGQLVPKLRCA